MESGHQQEESLKTLRLWPLQARWRTSVRVALRGGRGQSLESRLTAVVLKLCNFRTPLHS